MILIIGGAYQGKIDFVKNEFKITEDDIFYCNEKNISLNFNKKVIYKFEKLILALIENNIEPISFINENLENFKNKIIICEDISCGIVPIEYKMRILREKVGQSLVIFSKNSDRVVRLFCGIPMDLK